MGLGNRFFNFDYRYSRILPTPFFTRFGMLSNKIINMIRTILCCNLQRGIDTPGIA